MNTKSETQRMGAQRRKHYHDGLRAEALACFWLRCKGWRIIARRARTPAGEIDIIARRRRQLAFVEVKLRCSPRAALQALSPRQQRRIVRAAQCWLAQHPQWRSHDMRFDLIAIARHGLPRHLADAFRADEVLPQGAFLP